MEAFMKIVSLASIALVGLVSTGCITPEKYNVLKLENAQLNDQLARSSSRTAEAEAKAASWKTQLDSMMAAGGNSSALTSNLYQQIANLTAERDDLNRKYSDAINKVGMGNALPVALTSELTSFADQNPDLVSFDPQRGIVKFKSDVTFAAGDAALTSQAAEVIQKFGKIVNSPAARGYELLVAGHTDNTPVGNPSTIQRGHKNNWYLSSHRAIGVAEALVRQGTSGRRLGVVGYADQRPVADNASPAGKAANRRVEVLILPNQVADQSPIAPAAASPVNEQPKASLVPANPAESK